MKTRKRYCIALNDEENGKLQKVKNHYKDTGVTKIFMSMVNAMYSKIPVLTPTENVTHLTEKASNEETE